jgi:putative acyl-CoA dehydrogenase
MVPPERRSRRPRQSDQVIDLRQAAASRNRGADAGVPDRGDLDLAAGDQALLDSVRRHAGPSLLPQLHEVGRHVGSAAVRRLAADVERTPPRLDGFDARGERVDRVVAHPGWDQLQREGVEAGLGGRPWASSGPHTHLARGAGLLLWAQTSASSAMALSTHYAATAALVDTPAAAVWLPRLASRRLETGSRRAAAKPGCSAGVATTEQGSTAPGAAPATAAVAALGGPLEGGPTWRLRGRKWFAGNVDADVLVVDAATDDGVGTFLVPRQLVDGRDNDLRTVRLRHGHALRAWVVGDVELDGAWAVRLDRTDRPDQGPDQPSAQLSQLQAARTLDAGLLAAAALRAALSRAGHHARHRAVPGGPLDTAPMVRTLLADIAVESESATVLALRLAAATDAALAGRTTPTPGSADAAVDRPDDARRDADDERPDRGAHGGPARPDSPPARSEHVRAEAARTDPAYEAALLRLAGPVSAMWLSRRAPQVGLEALELLGAAAWDDASELARVHRDSAAVLAGRTGNGLALQVVDVVSRDTDAVEAFLAECERARGGHPRLDAAVSACADLLRTAAVEARQDPDAVAGAARWLVERLAVTLQASLVVRECPTPVAEAYLAARLDGAGTRALGALPLGSRQTALVVDRALGDV